MFFNAKENFNSAEEIYKKDGTVSSGYKSAVVDLSKILEFYPDSKWVDDALLMMGKCYLRQKQYVKAKVKFSELLKHFPNSDLTNETKISLAQVEIALGRFEVAESIMNELNRNNLDLDNSDISLAMGMMNLDVGDTLKAIPFLEEAYKLSSENDDKIRILKMLKSIFYTRKSYKKCITASLSLVDLAETREEIFFEKLYIASVYLKKKEYSKGKEILKDLNNNEIFSAYNYKSQLALGLAYWDSNKKVKADSIFNSLLLVYGADFSKRNSLLISSSYLADKALFVDNNLEKSKELFDTCSFYAKKSFSGNKSGKQYDYNIIIAELYDKRKKYILNKTSQFISLESSKKYINNFSAIIDSLSNEDSFFTKDTTLTKEVLSQLQNYKLEESIYNYNNFIYNSFEILIDEFKDSMEAESFYAKLKDEKYIAKNNLKKIRFMLDNVNVDNDELASLVKKINLETKFKELTINDSLDLFFQYGSQAIADSNFTAADKYYTLILDKNQYSTKLPDILLSIARFYEYHLIDIDKAKKVYEKINFLFPNSDNGRFAQKKLAFSKEEIEAFQKKHNDDSGTDIWFLMDRRNLNKG